MKPKYLQAETAGRDRWMISYLDVLTILLIFFVAVAAKTLEKSKPVEAAKNIADYSAQTGAQSPTKRNSGKARTLRSRLARRGRAAW